MKVRTEKTYKYGRRSSVRRDQTEAETDDRNVHIHSDQATVEAD